MKEGVIDNGKLKMKKERQTNYFLKNVTTKIGSGATPRGGQEAYHDEGISLIRSQNVLDFDFSYNGLAFIDDDQAYKLKNVIVEENDILLNITGDSVARVCKVPTEVLPARVNQHVAIIRPNPKELNYDYLLYYLLNPPFKKYMLKIASDGATRNAITKVDIEDFEIVAPEDVDNQKEIATILSTLDQKIALLKKQNQTLEELAKTLFKRWFVDFEFPNEQGKPYKSSGGKMIASELGEIPEGWGVDELAELFDFMEGPGIRNWQYREEGTPFINIRLINNGNIDISKANYISNKEANGKYSHFHLKSRDMIVSTSGSLGKTAIVREAHLPLMLNTSVIRFRPKGNNNYPFLYQYLKSKSFETELLTLASGSVQLNFGPTHLKQIDMIIPSKEILDTYKYSCQPLYDEIISNYDQIDTLIEFRDAILPKLMSGSLEIKKEKVSHV